MITFKHLQFNEFLGEVLSEKETLDNIIDLVLDGKPSKDEKQYLNDVNTWSEYAFKNNKEYFTIAYNEDRSIASIDNSFFDLTVDFIDIYDGKLIKHLTMVYDKYDSVKLFKEDKHIKHPNETIFLSKVISYEVSDKISKSSEILFKENGKVTTFDTEIDKSANKSNTSAKETKVNVPYNFIRAPKFFNDLEYLLDYKNILKPEYLNLPV